MRQRYFRSESRLARSKTLIVSPADRRKQPAIEDSSAVILKNLGGERFDYFARSGSSVDILACLGHSRAFGLHIG